MPVAVVRHPPLELELEVLELVLLALVELALVELALVELALVELALVELALVLLATVPPELELLGSSKLLQPDGPKPANRVARMNASKTLNPAALLFGMRAAQRRESEIITLSPLATQSEAWAHGNA